MTVKGGPTGGVGDAPSPVDGLVMAGEGQSAARPVAFRILRRSECLRFLREQSVGRVAISRRALPAIAPAVYVLLGDELIFGPPAGSEELVAPEGNVVAFEVDDIDPATGAGCNVVAVGVVHPFDGSRPDRRETAGRWPGAVAAAFNLYSLSTQRISGRTWGPALSLWGRRERGLDLVKDTCRRE